ncbi:hypothetical protein [Pelagovum pacificum]|uniref:Uncharacterized protein n=1 Tax=Pelagovum pacificum TaxID=2588711 RepID=A0A5C5GEM5_9RHOB|nr:hypothetical protein [Pelagovum pacificum]QQA44476.1 hypothetical protein I8N54_07875 [Pelagovum pacificum]TNY32409.1 hypothetical protein FHY64_03700 [Pelagovum pacificum]
MARNIVFIATLWACLLVVWLFSGEQFLDLMFAIPDAGAIDDAILEAVVGLEEVRATLGVPDLFAQLRELLHGLTGLG